MKKETVMKNGSPGNLSSGQGICRLLFAASCGGRTTPGFPGQIRRNKRMETMEMREGPLQVHCQCHDRQRYGMLGEISVSLKVNLGGRGAWASFARGGAEVLLYCAA